VKKPEVVAHYLQLVREMTDDLAQFERIKKVALLPKELTQAAGELTPTFKVKRRRRRGALQGADRRPLPGCRLSRATRILYLATLAFIRGRRSCPSPWIHENARWSDELFALATLGWALGLSSSAGCRAARGARRPRALRRLGGGLARDGVASPPERAGEAPRPGDARRAFVVTSDLAGRRHARGDRQDDRRHLARTALAALAGVVLSGFGIITPLVGTCGDLLPGPLSRAQAGFPHPNLLANFCVFAYGVVAREDSGLSRRWRRLSIARVAIAVVLTTSRAILAFGLAAAIRHATTPARRRFASGLAAVLVAAMLGLTLVNVTFQPLRPWDLRSAPGPSVRLQTATSSLATLAAHPLFGSGLGSSPGRRGSLAFDAHFTPLNVAASLGLPALAGLTFLVYCLCASARGPTDLALWGMLAGIGLDGLGQDVEDFRHVWVALGLADAARRDGEAAA
jgi:hypothetical protein